MHTRIHTVSQVWPWHVTSSILICIGNTSPKKAKGRLLNGLLTQLYSQTERQPLIHSLSKVRTQTHDPVRKRTLRAWYWEICLCFSFLHSPQVCDAKCEAAGSPGEILPWRGLRADSGHWGTRPLHACAAPVGPSSFFVVSPSTWRSSNIPVMGFMSFLSPPLAVLSSLRGVGGEALQKSSINVRAEEPRVRVSFHQPVNDLLSVVKAVHGGSLDVPFDLLSGVIVDVDLFRRFCFNELLINLLGSWGHSEWRLDLFVVLTREPELNVLVAVFGLEKVAKSSQSIFRLEKLFQWLWPLLGIF